MNKFYRDPLISFFVFACASLASLPDTAATVDFSCHELFASPVEFIAPVEAELLEKTEDEILGPDAERVLEDMDREARMAVNQVILKDRDQARIEVRNWLNRLLDRQNENHRLSVIEHSALVHMLRSGFLIEDPDRKIISDIEAAVERSWTELTGEHLMIEQILNQRLPKSILEQAPHDDVIFHNAVFDTPRLDQKDLASPSMTTLALKRALVSLGLVAVAYSHTGGDVLAGAVMGYTVSSLIEYGLHRYVLHASSEAIRFFKKSKSLGGTFWEDAYYLHTVVHHGFEYGKSYVKRFSAKSQIEVDQKLQERNMLKLGHDSQYGSSMSDDQVWKASLLTMGPAAILAGIFGYDFAGYAMAMGLSTLTVPATKVLHPYLHLPGSDLKEALDNASPVTRWILKTKIFALYARYHYVHHQTTDENGVVARGKYNFSLFIPGADWLIGKLKKPSVYDVNAMIDLGIIR